MSVRPRSAAPNPGRGGDGRRLRWSESPVPRPGVRRVRAVGAPVVAPLYWWKLDDASGDSVEVNGGPSLSWTGPGTPDYQVTALAPDSTYAINLPVPPSSYAEITWDTTGLNSDSIILDFWVGGLVMPEADAYRGLIKIEDDTSGMYAVRLYGSTTGPDYLEFNGGALGSPQQITAYTDPCHVRWEIRPDAGEWDIYINGTLAGSRTGLLPSEWHSNQPWYLFVFPSYAGNTGGTTYDEIKIFGTETVL